jgi:hypothetical protein
VFYDFFQFGGFGSIRWRQGTMKRGFPHWGWGMSGLNARGRARASTAIGALRRWRARFVERQGGLPNL